MTCPSCRQSVAKGQKLCPSCGEELYPARSGQDTEVSADSESRDGSHDSTDESSESLDRHGRSIRSSRRRRPEAKETFFRLGAEAASFLLACGLGGALTVAFFQLVIYPLGETAIGKLFITSGWVAQATVFLTAWAICTLAIKIRALSRQRGALEFDLLPRHISRLVRMENVDRFSEHIRALPFDPRSSFLVGRVLRALDYFKSRGKIQEVASFLSSQSDLDAKRVELGYTLLRVAIWAIPILGFIGTVQGISEAVNQFSEAINKTGTEVAMTTELGKVCLGLGKAFGTTLIALVLGILVMFPTSMVQKAEEDLLNSIEDYCNDKLLRRLQEDVDEAGGGQGVRDLLAEMLVQSQAELREWKEELKATGSQVSREIAGKWRELHEELQREQAQQTQRWDKIIGTVIEKQEGLVERIRATGEEQVKGLAAAVEALGKKAFDIHDAILGLEEKQLEKHRDVVGALSEDLKALRREHAEQVRTDAASHRSLYAELGGLLERLCHQAETTGQQVSESLEGVGPSLRSSLSALTEHMGQISKLMADQARSALETLDGRAERAAELLRGVEEATAAVNRESRGQLAAFSEMEARTIDAFGKRLSEAFTVHQALLTRAQDKAASRLSELGEQILARLGGYETQLRDHVAALSRIAGEGEKLAALERTLVENRGLLASDESLKKLLTANNQALAQLGTTMKGLGVKIEALGPGDDSGRNNSDGFLRKLFRRSS